mgnify:CR=1 FL=1
MLHVTQESFINYCLDKAFERNVVRDNRKASVEVEKEISFWIKKNSLMVENGPECLHDQTAWQWRLKPTLDFFEWVLKYSSLDLDCKFILDPSDLTGATCPPNRSVSLLGYGASLLSDHFSIPDPHFLSYAGILKTHVDAGMSHCDQPPQRDDVQVDSGVQVDTANEQLVGGGGVLLAHPFQVPSLFRLVQSLREGRLDRLPFKEKKAQALFRGGSTNPQRRRLSYSTVGNPLLDIKLTFHAPHDELISSPDMSVQEHLEYSYILDMYGGSASWDRSCWVLPSSSILLAVKPSDPILVNVHTWYSNFLYAHDIVPQLSEDELLGLKDFSRFCHLNDIQQNFSRLLLSHTTILNFMIKFLERYNEEFNS